MNSNKVLLEALNAGSIDAALISTPDEYNSHLFETWTIFSDSIYLAVPVQDADTLSVPVDLSLLQSKKFIALSEGSPPGEVSSKRFVSLVLNLTLRCGCMIFFVNEHGECRSGLHAYSRAHAWAFS